MTDPAPRDTAPALDRLLVSLCCGLLLLAPLTWLLGASSYLGVLAGLVACVLTGAAFGSVLQREVPGSLGVCLVTVAYVVPVVLVALLVAGPEDDRSATVLTLGVPAAALGAGLTLWTASVLNQDEGREGIVTGALVVGLSTALCAIALAPKVDDRLEDGRHVAAIATAFEGDGLMPLAPEIDGFSPADEPRVYLDSEGYWIKLVADGEEEPAASFVRIDAGPRLSTEGREAEEALCESEGRTCTQDPDGFFVMDHVGHSTTVVATIGRMRLEASLVDGEGDLPEAGAVGRALVDAELVDWEDLLRLGSSDL